MCRPDYIGSMIKHLTKAEIRRIIESEHSDTEQLVAEREKECRWFRGTEEDLDTKSRYNYAAGRLAALELLIEHLEQANDLAAADKEYDNDN